jgi:hypothetical protein
VAAIPPISVMNCRRLIRHTLGRGQQSTTSLMERGGLVHYSKMPSLTSPLGQSRPKSNVRLTSAFLLITTEQRTSHEVGSGPQADIQRRSNTSVYAKLQSFPSDEFVSLTATILLNRATKPHPLRGCCISHCGKIQRQQRCQYRADERRMSYSKAMRKIVLRIQFLTSK